MIEINMQSIYDNAVHVAWIATFLLSLTYANDKHRPLRQRITMLLLATIAAYYAGW